MAISKKISELDVLTSPQDLTKLFPPLFAQDGSPLNIRMSMAEVLKSARQVTITDATVGTSTSILSIAPTWTTNGTYAAPLLVNVTDSGTANAASKLLDLQVGGSSRLSLNKSGDLTIANANGSQTLSVIGGGSLQLAGNTVVGGGLYNTGNAILFGPSSDCVIQSDAADRLALRRAANAQRFSVYRTWSAADNFERGVMSWYDSSTNDGVAGTVLRIGTEKGSVGGTGRDVVLISDGTEVARFLVGTGSAYTGGIYTQVPGGAIKGVAVGWNTASTLGVVSGGMIGFVSSATDSRGAPDIAITRPATNILGITNGSTGPGTLAIDNVQGTNFERLKMEWDTNVARIGTSKGGSGTARDFAIITDNAVRVTFAAAGGQTAADGHNMAFGTSTGTKIGTATGQKIGFWNATPVVQQVLATGAGATVDNVITLLQTLGLCKQS